VPEYPVPPDNLERDVIDAVDVRLGNSSFVSGLGLAPGQKAAGSLLPVSIYALATQQPISLKRLHTISAPSSWGFLLNLTGGFAPLLFAAAGPSADDKYRFSNIIRAPASFTKALDFAREGDGPPPPKHLSYLQVPTYYLQAFWLRYDAPEDDRLYFVGETFGAFDEPEEYYPLADLETYMNDQLKKSRP